MMSEMSEAMPVRMVRGPRRQSAGQMVRAIRLRLGMSQTAFAEVAHLSNSTISRIEAGDRGVGPKVMEQVRDALELTDAESCDLACLTIYGEVLRADTRRPRDVRDVAELADVASLSILVHEALDEMRLRVGAMGSDPVGRILVYDAMHEIDLRVSALSLRCDEVLGSGAERGRSGRNGE